MIGNGERDSMKTIEIGQSAAEFLIILGWYGKGSTVIETTLKSVGSRVGSKRNRSPLPEEIFGDDMTWTERKSFRGYAESAYL